MLRLKHYINRAVKSSFAALGFYIDNHEIGYDLFKDIHSLLKTEPSYIFDVGANKGAISWKYLKAFPRCVIHAFEPDPRIYPELESLAQTTSRLRPFKLALGESEGSATMNLMESTELSSLLPLADSLPTAVSRGGIELVAQAPVSVATLDNHCQFQQVDRIDLLKLDVQGYSLAVLRGATGLLREKRIKLIYTEVEFTPIYQSQPLFHGIVAFLDSHGYRLVDLYDKHREEDGRLIWSDALFAAQ